MRVLIEAEPGEVAEKAADLLKAIATDLAPASEVARAVLDALEDSDLNTRDRPLRPAAIEKIRRQARQIVEEELRVLEREATRVWAGEEDELEKARTHKYLMRIPTGNPKRPWRYVYDYRSAKTTSAKTVNVVRDAEKEVQVGTAIRDRHEDHEGHWHVQEVGGTKYARTYRLRHDETGEEREISERDLLTMLRERHEPALAAEEQRRRAAAGQAAKVAYQVAVERYAAYEQDPSSENLYRVGSQWALVRKRATEAGWKINDWAREIGVSTELPPRWKDLREEYQSLQDEMTARLGIYAGPERLLVGGEFVGLFDPNDVRKMVRFGVLRERLEYGHGDAWREVEEKYGRAHRIDAEDVVKDLVSRGELNDRKILNALARSAWGVYKASELKAVVLSTQSYSLRRIAEMKGGMEVLQKIRAFAKKRAGMVYVSSESGYGDGTEVPSYYGETALSRLVGGDTKSPRPEMYAEDWESAIPPGDELAERLGEYETDPYDGEDTREDRRRAVARLRDAIEQGADPLVSHRVLVRTKKPRGPPYKVEEWAYFKGKSFRTVTAPVSTVLASAKKDEQEIRDKALREHKGRVAKTRKAIDAVAEKLGDVESLMHGVVHDVLSSIGVDKDVVAETLDRKSFWSLASRAFEHAHPEVAKRAAYSAREKLGLSEAEHKAARDQEREYTQALRAQMRDRILDAMSERLGVRGDVEKALQKVYQPTEQEARESWVMASHKTGPKSVEETKPGEHVAYDIERDPGRLKRLLSFVHPDVMPAVRLEVHEPQGRAHCTHDNVVRLEATSNEARSPVGDTALWHEVGHAIEHANSGIIAAANALRDERGKATPLQTMNEAHETKAYEDNEKTYRDHWVNPYTGKWYGHLGSTEVLSMGTEALIHNPLEFLSEDREHFLFTVAALTGAFGTVDRDPHKNAVARHEQFRRRAT